MKIYEMMIEIDRLQKKIHRLATENKLDCVVRSDCHCGSYEITVKDGDKMASYGGFWEFYPLQKADYFTDRSLFYFKKSQSEYKKANKGCAREITEKTYFKNLEKTVYQIYQIIEKELMSKKELLSKKELSSPEA